MAKKLIRLYEQDTTDFSNNGLKILSPMSAKITRNLIEYTYQLELTHLLDEKGMMLTEERILGYNGQYFRISSIRRNLKEVSVIAKHIFFDLNKNFIEDINIKNKTGSMALAHILGETSYPHSFSATSDIDTVASSRLVRKNVVSALIGDTDNSFINRWGGELDIDGFTFKLNEQIGKDNGYTIQYGKNLTGLDLQLNMLEVVTRIRPVGFDGIEIDGLYVDSPYIDNYALPIIKEIKYENVKWKGSPNYEEREDDDSYIYDNLAEAQAKLIELATNEFVVNEIDLPKTTINIEFIELSKTEEYKHLKFLQNINIGDTVHIYHKPLDINLKSRCIGYVYDCILNKYETITLGSYTKNFFTKTQNTNNTLDNVSNIYETKADSMSKIEGVNGSISVLVGRVSSTESKITDEAITNTVKQNFYTKTETDGKVTIVQNSMNSSITQLSNQIATKVDVNGVKSTIEQNPSSVQIGFNKISDALTVSADGLVAKTQSGNKYFQLGYNGMTMYNPVNGTHQWGKVAAINNKFTVASNGNSSGLSLGHHVNENYVEDILCDSNGVVSVQRQMNHGGIYNNTYGQISIHQSGQGGWEITGRSDSQSIKPSGANQGAIGSNTQYINQSWIANRYNPSSLEITHLSHYVDDLECLKLVSEVQPARYFYKEYDEDGNDITTFTTKTSQLGLIYEDVRECSGRDLLTNEEDKAINSYGMISVLWGAVRNLNERLNKLEYENALLNDELQNYKQKEGND